MKEHNETVVYTIDTSLRNAVADALIDYAAGETFPSFSSDVVSLVRVQRDGETYTLKKEEDTWTLEGLEEALDQDAVDEVISKLDYTNYSDYVSYYCEDPSEYGLDTENRIMVNYDDTEISFAIGSQDESGNYYVQSEGSDEIHTLSETLVSTFLELDAEDLKAEKEESETEDTTS